MPNINTVVDRFQCLTDADYVDATVAGLREGLTSVGIEKLTCATEESYEKVARETAELFQRVSRVTEVLLRHVIMELLKLPAAEVRAVASCHADHVLDVVEKQSLGLLR